jgi:hypothetical protein
MLLRFIFFLLLLTGCATRQSGDNVCLDTTWEVHDAQPLDRFAISRRSLANTPAWEQSIPFKSVPLPPEQAAKLALGWYKSAYPKATGAFAQDTGMAIFQQDGLRRWYYLIRIDVPPGQRDLLPTQAVHIVPVLLDGTVVPPRDMARWR